MTTKDDIAFKINQAAGSIGFGRLQTIATFLAEAKSLGLTIDDIITFVEEKQVEIKKTIQNSRDRRKKIQEILKDKSPKCPDCGNVLRIIDIGYDNDKGYKSRWFCVTGYETDHPDKLCGYEKLNEQSMEEIIEKIVSTQED